MLCDLGQITESLWASGLLIYKMGRMIVISLIIAIRLLWKLNENTCKPMECFTYYLSYGMGFTERSSVYVT